jgi:ATP-binding cassette subfamily F protein 3
MLASNYDKTSKTLSFTAYKKTELDKLLLDWEVVQEEIDNL